MRALARRLNLEARSLAAAGAVFLQIDEPFLAGYPDQAALAVEAVNLVTDGVPVSWALHVCYGNRYARPSQHGLGVIDVKSPVVETPALVAERIRRAVEYVEPTRLMVNPDCGLRHLAPEVARRKLRAMVAGAAIVRTELGSHSRRQGSQPTGDSNG